MRVFRLIVSVLFLLPGLCLAQLGLEGENIYRQLEEHGFVEINYKTAQINYYDALEQQPQFKQAVEKKLEGVIKEYPWLKNPVVIPAQVFQHPQLDNVSVYALCRAHECNTQKMCIVYQPSTSDIWYKLKIEEEPIASKANPIIEYSAGEIPEPIKELLALCNEE